ncbi:MAG: DNA mismatch repair protein MutS [Actinomycetota bacterium]|nr:DNA mismatch repair protein MutS [Actinomycetota bacterium]
MKARLLYRDRDFDAKAPLPWQAESLTQDLDLTTLFQAMAQGDAFILDLVAKVMFAGFERDIRTIRYRQEILADCLRQPVVIRELYALAVEAAEEARKQYRGLFFDHFPDSVLRYSLSHMEALVALIKRLRRLSDARADHFASEGWTAFFARLTEELDDDYVARIEDHLTRLKFRGGVLLSAELGEGHKGARCLLHPPPPGRKETWWTRFLEWLEDYFPELWYPFKPKAPPHSFSVHPLDESGARALAEVRNRGIGLAANALAQSAEHVRGFFNALRTELAFYVGCLNLHDVLVQKKAVVGMASPRPMEEGNLSFQGLYDICLALHLDTPVVGNDANADEKDLVLITGANQGGKSTLLRAIGLAQLMMQCGMFVPAESFAASVRDGLFTHYKREEDTALKSGKLDEELSRMSEIVDHLTPHSLVLLNESFAATNEREGSEIARQIIAALLERDIGVVCVTHLYELARWFHERNAENILFLRAERERTFQLVVGEPLRTSFGEDLYHDIFGSA